MTYTPRSNKAAENAASIRANVKAMLPSDDLGPVSFYWRHRANKVVDGELVSATVWSQDQELQGRKADDGRYGFEVRVSEATKALADGDHLLPRPVYLDVVHMANVAFTPRTADRRMLVLAD